jgi:hypothetical protein
MNVKLVQRAELELLKHRLLLHRLNETTAPECHPQIIQAAAEAADLAATSAFPLLLFPCLFEERAAAAAKNARCYEEAYWRMFEGKRQKTESARLPAPGQYLMLLRQHHLASSRRWCSQWVLHSQVF